jgi:hypothetical protein
MLCRIELQLYSLPS